MKVFLMPNLEKENAPFCTKRAAEVLYVSGAEVLIEEQYLSLCGSDTVTALPFEKCIEECDILIAIVSTRYSEYLVCGYSEYSCHLGYRAQRWLNVSVLPS